MRNLLLLVALVLASSEASATFLPTSRVSLLDRPALVMSPELRLLPATPLEGAGSDAGLAGCLTATTSIAIVAMIVGGVFAIVGLASGGESGGTMAGIGLLMAGGGGLWFLASWLCWQSRGGGDGDTRRTMIAVADASPASSAPRGRSVDLLSMTF